MSALFILLIQITNELQYCHQKSIKWTLEFTVSLALEWLYRRACSGMARGRICMHVASGKNRPHHEVGTEVVIQLNAGTHALTKNC